MPDTNSENHKVKTARRSRRRMYWTMILGGLAIVGSGSLVARAWSHRTFASVGGGSAGTPVNLPKNPPNPETLSFHPKSGDIFQKIQRTDQYYRSAAVRWIAFRFADVSSKGANAGTISLAALRAATGIVPFPKTLAKAGVRVPANLPPQTSIQGIASSTVNRLVASAAKSHVQLTSSQAQDLLRMVGNSALAIESNNPLSFLKYVDGVAPAATGHRTAAQVAVDPKGALMRHIVGVGHGILPNAVHFYRTWAVIPSHVNAQWKTGATIPGQTVKAEVTIQNPVFVHGIATGERGGVIGDIEAVPLTSVTAVLVSNHGQSHWYIANYQLPDAKLKVSTVLANAVDGQTR